MARVDDGSHPTDLNRPICPARAALERAAFVDPTAEITDPEQVTLGPQVYVGPFARLLADERAGISIGPQCNVQDNVTIQASYRRSADEQARVAALGLGERDGVQLAERVIAAHGATIKGPARLGLEGTNIPVNRNPEPELFLSFACEVDGAILEKNTGVAVLARVGPGVRLRSGFIVLPGKNVTTQAEADEPSLGKVRLLTADDVAFNEAVIEVNTGLAREYARLFAEHALAVQGINYSPGHTSFNPLRHSPILDPGLPVQVPEFRNRVIGAAYLADSHRRLEAVMGRRISIRADEGYPIHMGHINRMGDGVIFHALEHSHISVGDDIWYGDRVIVHGGGRRELGDQSIGDEEEPTFIGDLVTLKAQAVVFRSQIARSCSIGVKSGVINSALAPGTVIPDRVIFLNDAIFGPVEW